MNMRFVITLILAAAAALLGAIDAAETTLGSAVSLQANSETTVTFSDAPGLELVIETNAATSVTLSGEASISAGLLSDYSAFSFDAGAGFKFELSNSNAGIVKAQLTTPALSASVLALISGAVEVRCVRFDASAEAYTGVDVESVSASNKVVVELPKTGTYAFATVNVNVPVPTLYLEARATSSSSTTKLSFGSGEFTLDVSTTSSNEVTVDFSASTSRSGPSNATGLGAYYSINLATEESVDATLKYKYDSSISAQAAATLRFAYFDTDANAWVFVNGGSSVDTNTRVVSQITTHFSEWGVYGSNDEFSAAASSRLAVAAASMAAVIAGAAVFG